MRERDGGGEGGPTPRRRAAQPQLVSQGWVRAAAAASDNLVMVSKIYGDLQSVKLARGPVVGGTTAMSSSSIVASRSSARLASVAVCSIA